MSGRDEPEHGTRRRYQWRRAPCRCADCRGAHAAYHRGYRARRALERQAHRAEELYRRHGWHQLELEVAGGR